MKDFYAKCVICNGEEYATLSNGDKVQGGKTANVLLCSSCTQIMMKKTSKVPWDGNVDDIKGKRKSKYMRLK